MRCIQERRFELIQYNLLSFLYRDTEQENFQREFLPILKLLIQYHRSKASLNQSHCHILQSKLEQILDDIAA